MLSETMIGGLVLFGFLLFFLAARLFRSFLRFVWNHGILIDVPNRRSSHVKPTPRGAGVVFVWITLLLWTALSYVSESHFLPYLIFSSLLVALVGLIDDYEGLSIRIRLCTQILAAVLFLSVVPMPDFLRDISPLLYYVWFPLALFFIVSVTNLYNFMDGIDGIVSLHSVLVLASWILLSLMSSGYTLIVPSCLFLLLPLLAFCRENWSPAKMFMGDVGSTFLGFVFACLAIVSTPGVLRLENFFCFVVLMLPLLFDASFTLLVRIARKERWVEAHRQHLFQRLVQLDFSHKQVAGLYGLLTLHSALMVILPRSGYLDSVLVVGGLLLTPYLSLFFFVRALEHRQERGLSAAADA